MPEAAAAARTRSEFGNLDYLGARDGRNDELGDTVAGTDGYWRGAEIHKQYLNFTAIIGVDRAGRIDERQSLVQRASAARAHLPLEADRDFERDTGRDRD